MQALATEPADESCAVEVTDMQGTVLGPGLVLLTYVSSRNGRAGAAQFGVEMLGRQLAVGSPSGHSDPGAVAYARPGPF